MGATHVLRAIAGQGTKRSTGFGLVRNVCHAGANLSVTSDREVVAYTVDVTRKNLDTSLKFLQDASLHQVYKPWELDLVIPRVKADLARVTPQIRAVDLLHRAAFRTGLGNSVFCAKHHVGRLSTETLQHYVNSNYTTSRGAIVGVGIDHQQLVGFAKNLYLDSGAGAQNAVQFNGLSDLRVDKAGEWAHVAVATQGGALANPKEALAFAVLQRVAGTTSTTSGGNNDGALAKVVSAVLGNSQYGFSALNASYSDSGLFGFVVSADAREVGKVRTFLCKVIGTKPSGCTTR